MDNKEFAKVLLVEATELLTEGAVKTNNNIKNKMDKYLSKYGYDKNIHNATKYLEYSDGRKVPLGKIKVDGKEVYVDSRTNRNASTSMSKFPDGSNMLTVGKYDFAKLKNNKRRDAILSHEIAHAKYHNQYADDITVDRFARSVNSERDNKEDFDFNKEIDSAIEKRAYYNKPFIKMKDDYNEKDKKHSKNLKVFDEYENGKEHNYSIEFDADAYARSKHGSQLDKAQKNQDKNLIKKSYKTQKNVTSKEIDKLKEKNASKQEINDMKDRIKRNGARIRQSYHDDTRYRKKASTDKRIDKSVYNESIAVLLTEAALLLNDDYETLNEVSNAVKGGAALLALVGLGIWSSISSKKDNKRREEEYKKREQEREEREEKERQKEKEREKGLKVYIDSISKTKLVVKSEEDVHDAIIADIKKIISAIKKDKTYMNRIKEDIKELKSDFPGHEFFGFICEDNGDYVEIIDGTDITKSHFSYIIEDIKIILNARYRELGIRFGTGDGDEGCIYIK